MENAAEGKTVTVTFVKSWRRWYTGDRAGFAPAVADALVKAGVAHLPGILQRVGAALGLGAEEPAKAAPVPEVAAEKAYEAALAAGKTEDEALEAAEAAQESTKKRRRK